MAAVTLRHGGSWQRQHRGKPNYYRQVARWVLLGSGAAVDRRGTTCQRAAYKHNGRCALNGGPSTGARTQRGVQRISDANLKHGRQTKDKLAARRHAAKVGRRVRGELKRIEQQIVDAGLMPDN